jgi:hypothetical protein
MADALGTAFTYQGRLMEGGNPTNRIYDLRFTVCDAMSNGLFPVTLDCGPGVFTGENRRLNIAVRTNGTLLTTFTNPTPLISDYFGCSVAAVETGRVLVGAYANNTRAIDAGLV